MTGPRIIELPRFLDPRGNLAVIEECRELPFKIERCHWIYDVPGGGDREGHAYHTNEELIVALSGSFDVITRYPDREERVTLNRSYLGLYVPRLTWREITNFSTNAVVLVLSSRPYADEEYILDYKKYLALREKAEKECTDDYECAATHKEDASERDDVLPGLPRKTVYDCSVIELDRHPSERLGNLSVIQSEETLPFDVKRVFFIYDVPGGESRGGHAHRAVKEFIVAAAGSFCITLDDGRDRRTVMLNRPYMGLLVEPGVWLTLHDFSSGAIALVATSDHFHHSDHIKDYPTFLSLKKDETLQSD